MAEKVVFGINTCDDDAQQLHQEETMAAAAHQEEIAGKRKKLSTQIDFVADLILEEILSRIPAKTVFSSKIVSKPWLSILDNPIFARAHFSRAPVCPLLVLIDRIGHNSSRFMHLLEGQTVSDLAPMIGKSRLRSRFDFSNIAASSPVIYDIPTSAAGQFLPVNSNVVSCEGIVCWASYHICGGRIFLCNPITIEYFSLDPPPNEPDTVYVFIGVGFVRATQKFELLRMSLTSAKSKGKPFSSWVPEVLTVGDTNWRQVEVDTDTFDLSGRVSEVIYVNGAIYWRYDEFQCICSFDFDMRIFQVIRVPRMNRKYSFDTKTMSLGVLANSLCVSLVSRDNGRVSLWVLDSHDNVDQSVSWSKICNVESRTTYMGSRSKYKAIKYLDSGEILMQDWGEHFLIYDPIKRRDMPFRALESSSFAEMGTYFELQMVHTNGSPCTMPSEIEGSVEHGIRDGECSKDKYVCSFVMIYRI